MIGAGLLLAGCSGTTSSGNTAPADVAGVSILAPSSPEQALLELSELLLQDADTVVVSGDLADEDALELAETLGAPLLPDVAETRSELRRLGVDQVLALEPPSEVGAAEVFESVTDALQEYESGSEGNENPGAGALILWPDDESAAVNHLVALSGSTVRPAPAGDPRTDGELIEAVSGSESAIIAFGGAELEYPLSAIAAGAEQLWGGYLLLPNRHYIALYGHPSGPGLGLLGEQGPAESVERVQNLVAEYEAVGEGQFVPMFEIIATVASSEIGPDGDYSEETPIETLRPLVDTAREANIAVVLDLQPGRDNFLNQAREYEELLLEPHVGLALDPEWRLGPDEVHLRQIGSVDAAEVNEVSAWLAALTRENNLPQKMFVLHQFQPRMIANREILNTTHPELSTVIHVDGQGPPGAKIGTWNYIRENAPENVFWGWKNFIDEDEPMLTPQQTWQQVSPIPDLVTYQ